MTLDLQTISLIVSTASTLAMLFFAWATWQLYHQQFEYQYTPSVTVFSGQGRHAASGAPVYWCLVVNNSDVPIVLKDIKEELEHDSLLQVNMDLSLPEKGSQGLYINQFPWVISGRHFAIWSRAVFAVSSAGQGTWDGAGPQTIRVKLTVSTFDKIRGDQAERLEVLVANVPDTEPALS